MLNVIFPKSKKKCYFFWIRLIISLIEKVHSILIAGKVGNTFKLVSADNKVYATAYLFIIIKKVVKQKNIYASFLTIFIYRARDLLFEKFLL